MTPELAKTPDVPDAKPCNFCGAPLVEVLRMITSSTTGAMICDECIHSAVIALLEDGEAQRT